MKRESIEKKVYREVDAIIEKHPGKTILQYRALFRVLCPYDAERTETRYTYFRRRARQRMKEMFPEERLRATPSYTRSYAGDCFRVDNYYRTV